MTDTLTSSEKSAYRRIALDSSRDERRLQPNLDKTHSTPMVLRMQEVDLLILGAGWTSEFLIPLLKQRNITFAATTRDGRKVAGSETIKWAFNPDDTYNFMVLPAATTVLITFPLTGEGQSRKMVESYAGSHARKQDQTRFIQLGSTGIWQIPQDSTWVSRKSPYDKANKRAIAEDELLAHGGCVLNLAGLWGGQRDPRQWVDRVAKTKEDVASKKSLHMIHGMDVARAVIAISSKWDHAGGERWMLTDGFVYDWWALFAGWADTSGSKDESDHSELALEASSGPQEPAPSKQAQWVYELMREEDVPALPRNMENLGRAYDGREFWKIFKLTPLKARI